MDNVTCIVHGVSFMDLGMATFIRIKEENNIGTLSTPGGYYKKFNTFVARYRLRNSNA